ncbi:MAG: hypothetical protein IKN50_00870, partial [Clostridia bacterium]|nr:hypothetical protein [Clostridia bacterium]
MINAVVLMDATDQKRTKQEQNNDRSFHRTAPEPTRPFPDCPDETPPGGVSIIAETGEKCNRELPVIPRVKSFSFFSQKGIDKRFSLCYNTIRLGQKPGQKEDDGLVAQLVRAPP